jgi:hypothetical protein
LGQNKYKYPVHANGGLRVGGNIKVKVDSISYLNSFLKFYAGATLLNPNAEIFLNAENFGAIGDGTTECYTAIMNAVHAADTSLGHIVILPAGVFKVSTAMIITENVSLWGIPIMDFVFPYIDYPEGYTGYQAGSIIKVGGSGINLLTYTSDDPAHNEYAGPSIENIHFWDPTGYNDTLLTLRRMNHMRIRNCSFAMGACGINVSAWGSFSGDDASWNHILDNNFYHNNTGVYLNKGHANVPVTYIKGGTFHHDTLQTGIYAEDAGYTIIESLKMDIGGPNCIGINFKGLWGSITDVKMEVNGTDNTTIGILNRGDGTTMSGLGIQMLDGTGIGIKFAQGPDLAGSFLGNRVVNSTITSGNIGIWVEKWNEGVQMDNIWFGGSITTACIQLDTISYYHQISNITGVDKLYEAGGIVDHTTSSSIEYRYINGGARRYWKIEPLEDGSVTDDAPTQIQLNTAFDFTAKQAHRGFQRVFEDTDGSGKLYLVVSDGLKWHTVTFTEAP